MPIPDKMGIVFTDAEMTEIMNHFNGILSVINAKKVVQLTAEERKAAQSASDIRYPYIQNAIKTLAVNFPNLQPGFLSVTDAQNDLQTTTDFRELAALRNEVTDRMVDFAMAANTLLTNTCACFITVPKQHWRLIPPVPIPWCKPLARCLKGRENTHL